MHRINRVDLFACSDDQPAMAIQRAASGAMVARDVWGDAWHVRESRQTAHGFAVLLGRPGGLQERITRLGGVNVIVTEPLRAHLDGLRRSKRPADLPLGLRALKLTRTALGYNTDLDDTLWWESRADALADLPNATFCAVYGVDAASVIKARQALLGQRLRQAGWWRAPDVAAVLRSDLPSCLRACKLGITVGAALRLRHVLLEDGPLMVRPTANDN